MWWPYALLSALFAAPTASLARTGVWGAGPHLATAVRTLVVLVLAWGVAYSGVAWCRCSA